MWMQRKSDTQQQKTRQLIFLSMRGYWNRLGQNCHGNRSNAASGTEDDQIRGKHKIDPLSQHTAQHENIKHLQNDALPNKSLRERFDLADTYSASISRLIKEAVKEQVIKPLDESSSNKFIRYIPSWA